ncbi:hypothetical protein ACFL59_06270 [Planctomycetota bacterium]
MDKRRLIFGLALLLLIAGVVLACFAPGGFFNTSGAQTIGTPLGSFSMPGAKKASAGPIVGYALLGLGGIGLVVAFAMTKGPSED